MYSDQYVKFSIKSLAGSLSGFAIFLLSAGIVYGCSCAEIPTVDKEFAAAKHVVVVKADSHLEKVNGQTGPEDRVGGFNFIVQKVFKGPVLKPGQRYPMISTGMCSFGFDSSDLGREFLIYYFGDDRFEVVPMCTRSGTAEWRSADILYIENLPKVRGLTRISGFVTRVQRASVEGERSMNVPIADHVVRITGQSRSIRIKTDKNGVYEEYGLPPGLYRIEPDKVTGFVPTDAIRQTMGSANAVVPAGGHAESSFYFEIDNSITGKLLSYDGRPLPNVRLDLMPASGNPAKYFVETAYSDKGGTFKFERVPKGTYVIVGNRNNIVTAEYPYPRFYSSGTGDRSTGQEITIGAGDFREGFIVRASRPVETVKISGVLLFKDGNPVTTGTVKFVTGDGETRMPGDAYAHPDKNGNFTLRVLAGAKGRIFGYLPLNTYVFRRCLERVKAIQLKTQQAKLQFPETQGHLVESASEEENVKLQFSFSLCFEK